MGAEAEFIDDQVFSLVQLARGAVFDGENVPTRACRHRTFSRVEQRFMLVQAATMTPAISPGGLIMDLKKAKSKTQC